MVCDGVEEPLEHELPKLLLLFADPAHFAVRLPSSRLRQLRTHLRPRPWLVEQDDVAFPHLRGEEGVVARGHGTARHEDGGSVPLLHDRRDALEERARRGCEVLATASLTDEVVEEDDPGPSFPDACFRVGVVVEDSRVETPVFYEQHRQDVADHRLIVDDHDLDFLDRPFRLAFLFPV